MTLEMSIKWKMTYFVLSLCLLKWGGHFKETVHGWCRTTLSTIGGFIVVFLKNASYSSYALCSSFPLLDLNK